MPKLKWYYVTIDYRHAAGQGVWLGSIRAENEKEAIKEAVFPLRSLIDLRVDQTQAKISGWQRD